MSHDDDLVLADPFISFLDDELSRDPLAPPSSDVSRIFTVRSLLWDDEDNDFPTSSRNVF